MAGSKRNEIRQAFQQRVKRFSAFEMLGIDGKSSPSSDTPTENSDLISDPPSVTYPDVQSDQGISDQGISEGLMLPQTVPSEVTSDPLTIHQTPLSDTPSDPHLSDPLIEVPSDDTSNPLIEVLSDTSKDSQAFETISGAVPLAPLQWRVWQALIKAEGKVISHKGLATQSSGSIPGVRQAIQVIEREGGILSRETIREKTEEGAILQGFRVALNHAISFQQITSKESHRVQKRGLIHRHISDRLIHPYEDISDGLRMYVCKRNTYIRVENLAELLRSSPAKWQIREQTLIQIADAFPTMTALEFRLSLRRLVEQAQTGKQTIQNPNAWLKAAFEKNGGPLVTEREIEARLSQHDATKSQRTTVQTVPKEKSEEGHDLEMLRRYIMAKPEERAQIDQLAEKRVAPILAAFSEDKHAGILEQAKIECTRELFKVAG